MVYVETKQDYFNWKLPLYGALASALVSVPIAILGNDMDGFLYSIFLVPLLCLGFLWVVLWSFAGRGRWLASPTKFAGELKHVEWNGWGFPGAGDTVVYLVFDPEDSLSGSARNHSQVKVREFPAKSSRRGV